MSHLKKKGLPELEVRELLLSNILRVRAEKYVLLIHLAFGYPVI